MRIVKLMNPNGEDIIYLNIDEVTFIRKDKNQVTLYVTSQHVGINITPQEFEKKLEPLLVNETQVLKG